MDLLDACGWIYHSRDLTIYFLLAFFFVGLLLICSGFPYGLMWVFRGPWNLCVPIAQRASEECKGPKKATPNALKFDLRGSEWKFTMLGVASQVRELIE